MALPDEPLRWSASGTSPSRPIHQEYPRIVAFRFRTSHRRRPRIRWVVLFRNPITSVS